MNTTNSTRRRYLQFGVAAALASGMPPALARKASASADNYPNRPIRLVVPFPPGSATDIMTRFLEPHMSQHLGQPLVIDNRPGGAGVIGADFARRATPDGYTLVMDAASSHSTMAAMRPTTLPYDILTDFTSIGRACTSANVIAVNPSLPVHSLPELIAYSNTLPEGLFFASGSRGASNHLAGELLKTKGAKLTHVPYINMGQAITDTSGGTVPILIYTVALLPFIRDGKLRGIAVTSENRLRQAPEIPTAIEQGVDGMVAMSWFGLFGPAGLPTPIRDKVFAALSSAVNDPGVSQKLVDAGLECALLDPAETDEFVARDIALWKEVVKRAGVPVDE
ncbi:tripartite tricarboxylate transporter substrate binding protein [Verticiella sediminum]|uniref:Tripartite tricarboxylate transporter substrate binding protein n=1 Tax=Verticiella sediminum TaxID=1247510 RepID=A0A556AWR7_9BURK|nr:tripartite tricarboxylate transporter substrate-binding protein [Verticiella sediminum]TSH97391.1 tripartite tricarboxylate transporter substrate binding protein [Verticiella sediminum]